MDPVAFDFLVVAVLGGLVGVGELVSRYRDAPGRALTTVPAIFYVGINAATAAATLSLIRSFGWTFGAAGGTPSPVTQVLVAGFGAMAILRSSLFTVRVADQDVAVGPSSFLQIVLTAADRAVDRLRAQARGTSVYRVMAGISFAKAHAALPAYCLALMQNLSTEEQAQFGREIDALRGSQMDDRIKILVLGLALMNVVGEDVLDSAVKSLGQELRDPPPPRE